MTDRPLTPPPAPFVTVQQGVAPPGMIKAEADILNAWLTQHWQEYDSVTYNLRVGHGIDPGPQVLESMRQGAIANSQRRIDAVLMKGVAPTIIEVKVRGSLWALGQLWGYRQLWLRDKPGQYPGVIMLCGSIDPDTAYVYDSLGVRFEVVTP